MPRLALTAMLLLALAAPAWPEGKWSTGGTSKGTAVWRQEGRRLTYRGGADYGWAVNGEPIRDGFVEVRFRAREGRRDRAGGVVWRWQDPGNYYLARANALENNIVVYKFVDRRRTDLKPLGAAAGAYGVATRIASRAWHRLRVDFNGSEFAVHFNGALLLTVRDETFPEPGHVGVWSKADSVTQFEDFRAGLADALGGASPARP